MFCREIETTGDRTMAPQEPAWISEAPPSQPAPATYGTDATGNDSRLMYAWGAVKTIIVGCTAMMAANGVLAFINLDRSSNPVSDMFVVSTNKTSVSRH